MEKVTKKFVKSVNSVNSAGKGFIYKYKRGTVSFNKIIVFFRTPFKLVHNSSKTQFYCGCCLPRVLIHQADQDLNCFKTEEGAFPEVIALQSNFKSEIR